MRFLSGATERVNEIFSSAFTAGRRTLYEYEIYEILKAVGLEVPEFVFIRRIEEVDEKILQKFRQKVVIKIVSSDIAHKQKLGGVRIVDILDPMYIQFIMMKMKVEVLSHFDNEKPSIDGFLLVEFVPHTQAIGNEVLLGFKEDTAFGPVLTLSKGGDDAEFFAKCYDPANLFLPPLDYEDGMKMVNTLKIRHKFRETGHMECLELMGKAISVLSRLAYDYSFIADERPEFVIRAIDINPFVVTNDGRFVAIDGYAQFIPASEEEKSIPKINIENLDQFFQPEGIAVIGVSTDWNKYSLGRDIALLLHDLGRKDLYLVNAKGGYMELNGVEYKLYTSVKEIPSKVELAVYAAPAQFTVDFIRELPPDGPRSVVLISGIPSNVRYSEFEEQLNQAVPEGMRIIGPNCMGIFFAPEGEKKGLNTLFINEKRLEIKYADYSNTVFLTQSGALAVTAIDRLQNSRLFKSIVSFGNKYDVKITDLVAYFACRRSTDLISLYVEGFDAGEGRQFFQLARRIDKPILVYKGGRTEAGARAAASHTASMSGSYDVFKAAADQAGVILAENIEDFYDYLKAFSLLSNKIPMSNRVAGVVNAGFESTVGADELKNLRQAQLTAKTIEKLNSINTYGLADTSSPFLDITPMADDRMYADFVEAVLQDDNVDCVFVAIVPHAVSLKTVPETCHDEDSLANLLIELSRKYSKPMVVSVNAGRHYQDFVSILEQNRLPVYTDIRSAIKSLDRFVTYHISRMNGSSPEK